MWSARPIKKSGLHAIPDDYLISSKYLSMDFVILLITPRPMILRNVWFGCDDYISKPNNSQKLFELLNKYLPAKTSIN